MLTAIRRFGYAGARLTDIAELAQLSTSTTHRILQSLVTVDFVIVTERRYYLGPALFELGASAVSALGPLRTYRSALQKLADETGDTAYLAVRRSDEAVYVMRAVGEFPIRRQLVSPGGVLPLVDGYAGLALLGSMPHDECAAILDLAFSHPEGFPRSSRTTIDEKIEHMRQYRSVYGDELSMPGVSGVAVAIELEDEIPFVSLTVTASSSRLPIDRVPAVTERLFHTAEIIARLYEANRHRISHVG